MFIKEKHESLRGGDGVIITYTNVIFCGRQRIKVILIKMSPNSTIGLHEHTDDGEIYMTFNRNVRFGIKKTRYFNRCSKGSFHNASNFSKDWATVFAIKF